MTKNTLKIVNTEKTEDKKEKQKAIFVTSGSF